MGTSLRALLGTLLTLIISLRVLPSRCNRDLVLDLLDLGLLLRLLGLGSALGGLKDGSGRQGTWLGLFFVPQFLAGLKLFLLLLILPV